MRAWEAALSPGPLLPPPISPRVGAALGRDAATTNGRRARAGPGIRRLLRARSVARARRTVAVCVRALCVCVYVCVRMSAPSLRAGAGPRRASCSRHPLPGRCQSRRAAHSRARPALRRLPARRLTRVDAARPREPAALHLLPGGAGERGHGAVVERSSGGDSCPPLPLVTVLSLPPQLSLSVRSLFLFCRCDDRRQSRSCR